MKFVKSLLAIVNLVFLASCGYEREVDMGQLEEALSQSDDFETHKTAFLNASSELIKAGRCELKDFQSMGGWVKSIEAYKNLPVYFTYCGGMTSSNRIYLDVSTGKATR